MVVQRIIGPTDVCPEIELYYRTKGSVQLNNEGIFLEDLAELTTDTYMNVFDSAVWGKYTDVNQWNLKVVVCGCGKIELIEERHGKKNCLSSRVIHSDKEIDVNIPFQTLQDTAMYYIQASAGKKLHIIDACITVDSNEILGDIHMGIVICTYKRNKALYRTVETLKNSLFFQENSDLYQKLSIRIIDNASELPMINEHLIQLFHNKNTGGSGGFTRGISETRKAAEQYKITNVILMDDDVEIIPETFYRLFALLSLLKQEYQNEVVAGRMFRLEQRHIQYTAAEIWNKGNIRHIGFDKDMRKKDSLIALNDNTNAEYSGWWLACFPMEFIKENTPLPFFLHCDDVEYGLRHGGTPIILNGFQVWHESFECRMTPIVEYYDVRNTLFVNKICYPDYLPENNWEWWKKRISERHVQGNYVAEHMMILGMLDFLKGKSYLTKLDSEKKHKKLLRVRSNKYVNMFLWRFATWLFYIKRRKMEKSL